MTPSTGPTISVIVPTRHRPGQLANCLDGLACQTVGISAFEVLVVSDGAGSVDPDLAGRWRGRLDVRVFESPRRGPGAARNTGAQQARGTYLAFIDDDCVPEPTWLASFDVERLAEGALMGGDVSNALPGNAWATASHLITEFTRRYYATHPDAERFFSTNNLMARKSDFDAIGRFDTLIPAHTAEDKDLCDRWRNAGKPVISAPEARVQHAHQLGFAGFVRQHYRYGRGILCFRFLRRRRLPEAPGRIRPEPWSFYLGLIRYPATRERGPRGWKLSALVAISQLATVCGGVHAVVFDLARLRPR